MSKEHNWEYKTIEWLRFFCAFAVVLLHAVGPPLFNGVISYKNGIYDIIRITFSEGICRVAVPVFFVISGNLFYVKLENWNKTIWIDKIKKRIRTLFVPYLIWNILALVFLLLSLYPRSILKGDAIPDLKIWFYSIGGICSLWDTGDRFPINYPLWFIRNLMVLNLMSPIIYLFIKRLRVIGIIFLFILFVTNYWIHISGFGISGFFFFSLGAYFRLLRINLVNFCEKIYMKTMAISFLLLVPMVITYGNNPTCYECFHRVFALFGSLSTIGIVAHYLKHNILKEYPFLSKTSFFVYATHAIFFLPIITYALYKVFPLETEYAYIIRYFLSPIITIVCILFIFKLLKKLMPNTLSVIVGGRLDI